MSFVCDENFSIAEIDVRTIAVPHDAAEPCQFRLSAGGRCLGVLTDLGCITPHVVSSYQGCHSLLLEFNHDLDMLMAGAYPPQLKNRVSGDWGHLNNGQAADFLRQLECTGELKNLVVAHISEKNNSRDRAEQALAAVLVSTEQVTWAQQQEGFDWLGV